MAESARKILAQAYEREVRQRLGDGMRRSYDPMVHEPLPSDWLKLIDDLGSRRSSGATTAAGVLERLWQRLSRC
jgi:hypothetical protein